MFFITRALSSSVPEAVFHFHLLPQSDLHSESVETFR
jgi:hypothetical protein